ncbi:MAG TPA: ankyrin repeat domain-containing protein [Candidatus Angelobacter sp.]
MARRQDDGGLGIAPEALKALLRFPVGITIALHDEDRDFLEATFNLLIRLGYVSEPERQVRDGCSGILLDLKSKRQKDEELAQDARIIVTSDIAWEDDPFDGDWHGELIPGSKSRLDEEKHGARPVILRRQDIELPDFLFPAVVPDDPRPTFCNVINGFQAPARVPSAVLERLGVAPLDSHLKMAEALLVQSTWSLGLLSDLAKVNQTTTIEALQTVDPALDLQGAALLAAISQKDPGSVRDVLKVLSRPVSSMRFSGGNTPLHFSACFPGNAEIEKALLDAGIECDAKSAAGATALHWAVWNPPNHRVLIEKGADPCNVSLEGDSALAVAAWLGDTQLVGRLLDAGANPTLTDKSTGHPLVWAAQQGHLEVLKLILAQSPASIDVPTGVHGMGSSEPDFGPEVPGLPALTRVRRYRVAESPSLGTTALMGAASGGRTDVVKFLLDSGVRSDQADRLGMGALHRAVLASENALEAARALSHKGDDLERTDRYGTTPLILASIAGRADIVSMLAERGSRVDVQDNDGLTALHHAAAAGNPELVNLLLKDLKAQPSVPDSKGFTPLHHAVFSANPAVETIRALVNGGSQPDEKTQDGRSPLQCLLPLRNRSEAEHREIADCLLELGADPNWVGRANHSILYDAVSAGDSALVDALLQKNPVIQQEGDSKGTPLHAAVVNGHDEIVKKLLQAGVDPNIRDGTSESALHEAARHNRLKSWEALLEKGADPWLVADEGHTALLAAALRGYAEFCSPILAHLNFQADRRRNGLGLICAAALGDLELVDRLVAKISPDFTSEDGWRPLSAAALRGQSETVSRLLEAGANVNWRAGVPTAMCCAAGQDDIEIVRRLLASNADPNAPATKGSVPMHFAAASGNGDVLRELISAGAFVDARDQDGVTALHIAAWANNDAVAKTLIQAGANIEALDKKGNAPLHLAVAEESWGVVRMLLSAGAQDKLLNAEGRHAIECVSDGSLETARALFSEMGRDPGPARPARRATGLARFLDWRMPTKSECDLLAKFPKIAEIVRKAGEDILCADLAFLDQTIIFAAGDPSRREPPNQRFWLCSSSRGEICQMDWTNEPIYAANERFDFKITTDTPVELIRQYAIFFFFFVRGELGRFTIVEKRTPVPWRSVPPPEDQENEVANQLIDIGFTHEQIPNTVTITATVLFKNALFKTNVLFSLRKQDLKIGSDEEPEYFTIGQAKLFGEELLSEYLDVYIDPSPGEFG